MAELLVTIVFFSLFTGMVLHANRMLSSLAQTATTATQQQTLATVVLNSLLAEMRTASNIYPYTGDFNGHEHANFYYDSKLFDYLQVDFSNDSYREIIYVDSTNGKLYVGRADSLQGTSTPAVDPKPLIGGAMYSDCIIHLNDGSTNKTEVTNTGTPIVDDTGAEILDSSGNPLGYKAATFNVVIMIEDTILGTTATHTMVVNTNTGI